MSDQMPKIVTSRLAELEVRPEAWHPDADLLTAFLERTLPEGEKVTVFSHLAECAPCREIVALAQPVGEERQVVLVPGKPSGVRLFWRWGALVACAVLAVSLALHKRENRSLTLAQQENSAVPGLAGSGAKPSPAVRTEGDATSDAQTVIAGSLPAERRVAPLSLEPSAPVDASSGLMAEKSVARNDASTGGRELSAGNVTGRLQEPLASVSAPPAEPAAATLGISAARTRAAAPAAEVAGYGVAANDLAKKEVDAKADQQLLKAKVYGRVESKQSEAANAPVSASSQPATPIAPTDKDEFRASSSQIANVGAFTAARQAAAWQLTDAGNLQRSFDGGKSWESVSVNQPARLRVVATTGFHIWAGGNGGLLFHSEDGGNHFVLVKVGQNHTLLTGDIVTLAFSDAQHGRLETSIHEVWTTPDGGKTWFSSIPAK